MGSPGDAMMVLCAADLRDEARFLLKNAGFQGFVRIAAPGRKLLVTDAHRHIAEFDGYNPDLESDNNVFSPIDSSLNSMRHTKQSLKQYLKAGGFTVCEERGLLFFSPDETHLHELAEKWDNMRFAFLATAWDGFRPARALSERLLRCNPTVKWTSAGEQLILEGLRLPAPASTDWPELEGLRPRIAEMLRLHDRSGMRETGALLAVRLAYKLGIPAINALTAVIKIQNESMS